MTTPKRTARHEELAAEFGMGKSELKRLWKHLPHTYLGLPNRIPSVRNARFNIEEVREFLNRQRAD